MFGIIKYTSKHPVLIESIKNYFQNMQFSVLPINFRVKFYHNKHKKECLVIKIHIFRSKSFFFYLFIVHVAGEENIIGYKNSINFNYKHFPDINITYLFIGLVGYRL